MVCLLAGCFVGWCVGCLIVHFVFAFWMLIYGVLGLSLWCLFGGFVADEEFGCVCFNGFDLIGVEVLLFGLFKFDLVVDFVVGYYDLFCFRVWNWFSFRVRFD